MVSRIKNILNIPGAGAAGGLGAGLMAFTNAELSIGANIVLEALEYENNLFLMKKIYGNKKKILIFSLRALCSRPIFLNFF